MRIDLIALDLDGTLLSDDGAISPRNKVAIRRALDTGVRVVLVTGRGTDLPMRITRELQLNLPVICCHGALTKDFGADRTLVHIPVPLVHAKRLVEFAEHHDLSIAIYLEEMFWRLEGPQLYVEGMLGPHWQEVDTFADVLTSAPTFLRFLGRHAVDSLRENFSDLPLNFRIETWHDFVECAVLNPDASKERALMQLCADFQILPQHVLAIGDSRNDVPMLRWAGIGVAMGNALPEVRDAVKYVTTENEEDGVALAIERFVFDPRFNEDEDEERTP